MTVRALAAGLVLLASLSSHAVAEEAFAIPAPSVDEAAGDGTRVAVFAGGCFWGVQGVFQHVKGVTNAVSGYAGGSEVDAVYQTVGTGRTGHAEAVEITYRPSEVSFGELMHIFFSVAHDPTQLNYQGPDRGTQYRTAIFEQDEAQAKYAASYIAELNETGIYPGKIVTTLEGKKPFYPAEDYHQDFLTLNPTYPYIVRFDLPKIENLKALFPHHYREEPALVMAGKS